MEYFIKRQILPDLMEKNKLGLLNFSLIEKKLGPSHDYYPSPCIEIFRYFLILVHPLLSKYYIKVFPKSC